MQICAMPLISPLSLREKGLRANADLRNATHQPPLPPGEGTKSNVDLRNATYQPPLPPGEGWGEGKADHPFQPERETTLSAGTCPRR